MLGGPLAEVPAGELDEPAGRHDRVAVPALTPRRPEHAGEPEVFGRVGRRIGPIRRVGRRHKLDARGRDFGPRLIEASQSIEHEVFRQDVMVEVAGREGRRAFRRRRRRPPTGRRGSERGQLGPERGGKLRGLAAGGVLDQAEAFDLLGERESSRLRLPEPIPQRVEASIPPGPIGDGLAEVGADLLSLLAQGGLARLDLRPVGRQSFRIEPQVFQARQPRFEPG